MYKKQLDYDIEDICYYDEFINNNQLEYVRACQKDKNCLKLDKVIGICHNSTISSIKALGEDCKSDFECQDDLTCKNICNTTNGNVYLIKDPSKVEKKYYYCTSDNKPFLTTNQVNSNEEYKCFPKDRINEYCYDAKALGNEKEAFPDYLKVCGIISFDENTIKFADIGSVDKNNYVDDERACKSGLALYFSHNKGFNGYSKFNNNDYKVCVELNGVEKIGDFCYINYTKETESEIYNLNKLESTHSNDDYYNSLKKDCQYLTTKISLFKKYLEKFNNKTSICNNGKKYYNEPFTCGDDELRLLWYEYNNPEYYLLYKNEEDIINYLVKDAYPLYDPSFSQHQNEEDKNSNRSLTFKNMIILLILLLF